MKSRHQTDQTTFVVGHQRPDTDSAVSAVVYAALLNTQSRGGAFEGVVLGEPSAQTRWLFDGTGIPLPRQISHLHASVRDLAQQDIHAIGPDATLGEALELIMRHHLSVVPVLDENKKLLGLLSDRIPMAMTASQADSPKYPFSAINK